MPANKDRQREWALLGATARLEEIQAEVAEIHAAFPELRKGARAATTKPAATSGTRKRKFSASGKKAISAGMRKYWARRKALAAKAAKAGKSK